MTFVKRKLVRFAHVDAAGIVFYPRYFELVNAVIEDYFAERVGVDFATMHGMRRIGVPTVALDADFTSPSRLGDRLDFALAVARVGRTSAEVEVAVRCDDAARLRARVVLVCMDLDAASALAWPDDIRSVLAADVS